MEYLYKRDSERRLLEAVSTIIEEDGFSKLGINRIARVAECDKVLIYRYFGGLDGLLSEWAKKNDFYVAAYDMFCKEIEMVDRIHIKDLTKKVFIAQLHFLRENKMMQELIIWELSKFSKFTILLEIRERNGHKLQEVLNHIANLESKEIDMYLTLLIAGINYIVLYARRYSLFNGIDFSDPESWIKLEKVIDNYIEMIFSTIDL